MGVGAADAAGLAAAAPAGEAVAAGEAPLTAFRVPSDAICETPENLVCVMGKPAPQEQR